MLFISFSFLYISTQIKNKINQKSSTFSEIDNYSKTDYFENTFSWIIKQDQKVDFTFTQTNTWTIKLISWAPIYYEVFDDLWVIKEKNIISSNRNISNFYSWITLSTLWWFSKFEVTFSWTNWVVFPYNYEKIYKNIWWEKVLERVVEK